MTTPNVRTLVRDSAEVVRIVSLKPGDVYKRLVDGSYSDTELQLGVVLDVMNNGTSSAITAVEYGVSYGGLSVKQKVFTDKSTDVMLFPAQPEEISLHLQEIRESAQTKVEKAEQALREAREALRSVLTVIRRTAAGELTAATTEVVSDPTQIERIDPQ